MLGLRRPTDPAWLERALGDLPGLLSDHAHCELKAAQSALSVVARFGGEFPALVAPLTELAREESEHFARVHDALEARGAPLHKPDEDGYVRALRRGVGQLPRRHALLDRLLISALIEARSCERFKLLADATPEPELRAFYGDLMASEARHHALFARLAETCFGAEARTRLGQAAEIEADVVATLPPRATVHG